MKSVRRGEELIPLHKLTAWAGVGECWNVGMFECSNG